MGADVDDKRIFGDVLGRDFVVAAKKEDDFGRGWGWLEIEAKFKCVNLSLASVKNVVTVPSLLRVYEFIAVCDCSGVV